MKKVLSFIIFAVFISISANAANNFGGGFTGPMAETFRITTVQNALGMRDDTNVILRGHIVEGLGDEKYTFSDETGKIIVEIDNDAWYGINVTPETTIEIVGEIDKGIFKKTKIDVDSLRVIE